MNLFEAYSNIQAARSSPYSSDVDLKCCYEQFLICLIIEGKDGIKRLHDSNVGFTDRCKSLIKYDFECARIEDIIILCYALFHH